MQFTLIYVMSALLGLMLLQNVASETLDRQEIQAAIAEPAGVLA